MMWKKTKCVIRVITKRRVVLVTASLLVFNKKLHELLFFICFYDFVTLRWLSFNNTNVFFIQFLIYNQSFYMINLKSGFISSPQDDSDHCPLYFMNYYFFPII